MCKNEEKFCEIYRRKKKTKSKLKKKLKKLVNKLKWLNIFSFSQSIFPKMGKKVLNPVSLSIIALGGQENFLYFSSYYFYLIL